MECGALDVSPAVSSPYSSMLKKLLFGCIAFAVLSFMILNRPAWKLNDFDQPFYVAIAYDLDKYGVFSMDLSPPWTARLLALRLGCSSAQSTPPWSWQR